MFTMRMGAEKSRSEVLQNEYIEKEGSCRKQKIGRCIGSLYYVSDGCPFKHSAEEKSNTTNFQNVGGHTVCFNCGNIASRQWCSACNMTEYGRESENLTVYYTGAHRCPLKKDTKIYRKQVRDAVLRNRSIGA